MMFFNCGIDRKTSLLVKRKLDGRLNKGLHTRLQGLLRNVICEGSDAFVRDGCQGEAILCVGTETFHNI